MKAKEFEVACTIDAPFEGGYFDIALDSWQRPPVPPEDEDSRKALEVFAERLAVERKRREWLREEGWLG